MGNWCTDRSEAVLLWPEFNQERQLIAAHLIHSFGPGMYRAMSRDWPYALRQPEDVVPINHVLRFRTFGHRLRLRSTVESQFRWRIVSRRNEDGALEQAWIQCEADLIDPPSRETVGTGSFWMALSRPLMPRGQRRPEALPAEVGTWPEAPLEPDLLPSQSPAYYTAGGEGAVHGEATHVFHLDRSDLFQHVNTVVYIQVGLDHLARTVYDHGGDAGAPRFRDVTVYFRKPFVPGQAARVMTDYRAEGDGFVAAVRFHHVGPDGTVDERVSTALKLAGPVAG